MTTYAERRAIYLGDDLNTVMRAWGREMGYVGARGGWIYFAVGGKPICQGWWSVWTTARQDVLNWLTRRHTAFQNFDELLDTAPSYRPTICLRNAGTRALAAAYDQVQAARGDARRAYTYPYRPGYVRG